MIAVFLSDEIGHFRLDYVTISDINYSTGVIKILGTQDVPKLDNTVVDTENTKGFCMIGQQICYA